MRTGRYVLNRIARDLKNNPGHVCSVYDPNTHILINKWAPAVLAGVGIIIGFFLGVAHG